MSSTETLGQDYHLDEVSDFHLVLPQQIVWSDLCCSLMFFVRQNLFPSSLYTNPFFFLFVGIALAVSAWFPFAGVRMRSVSTRFTSAYSVCGEEGSPALAVA